MAFHSQFGQDQAIVSLFDGMKDGYFIELQKTIKKQKYDQIVLKNIQKTTNMIKIMTKCYKNVKFTKSENSRLTKNIFFLFLKSDIGPSTIIC